MKKVIINIAFLLSIAFLGINVKASELDSYLSTKNLNYAYYQKAEAKVQDVKQDDYIYVTAVIDNNTSEEHKLEKGKLTLRWDNEILELAKYNDVYYSLQNSDIIVEIKDSSVAANKITVNYVSNDTIKVGKTKTIEFKFHVLKNAKSGVTKIYDGDNEISCYKTNGETSEVFQCGNSLLSELQFNVQKSDINTLTSIKIDNKEIDNFKENNLTYKVIVDSNKETINIEALKKDSKSSVSGDLGTKSLKYGDNTFKITVTSESGKKNEYSLTVNRPDARSSINTLKSLKLSTGIINFKPEINEYTINVPNGVDTINIESSLTDSKSKYVNDFGNREIELSEGSNKVLIKIVAENGDENTYTIIINRALSGDNTLESLYVNDDAIELSNRVFNYTYEVENDVTSVMISAYPSDNNATVDIGNLSLLEIGDNEVKITVTARNGNKVTYNLNIIRKVNLSSNSFLKDIVIEGYKFNFNKDKTYYDLKIKDEDELNIQAIAEDETTIVKVEGNKNLVNGSVIRITAHAEDGGITRYFINIEKNSKSNILWIIIGLIILIIIAAVVVILLLLKRKKKIQNEISKAVQAEERQDKELEEKSMPEPVNEIKENDSIEESQISETEENKVNDEK